MAIQHARDLCEKLNIRVDKVNYFRDESHYEYYRFPLTLSVQRAQVKLKKVVDDNIFVIHRGKTDFKVRRALTIFAMIFNKPTNVYLYHKIPDTNEFKSRYKFTIPKKETPVYFIVPIQPAFFTDFHMHIVKDEDELITAELYIDWYSIIESTVESTYN